MDVPAGKAVIIGGSITVLVDKSDAVGVRLGIEAPRDMEIRRRDQAARSSEAEDNRGNR